MRSVDKIRLNGDTIHSLAQEIERTFNYKMVNDEPNYILECFLLEFKSYGILVKTNIDSKLTNVGAIFESGNLYWNAQHTDYRDLFQDLLYDRFYS